MKISIHRFSVIVFAASLVALGILNAQIPRERKYDPSKIVRSTLLRAAQEKYGKNYRVSFHIMDSLIAHSFPGVITDPYGTLKGCILFSAWREEQERDSVVTGMFRSGTIIWDDFPGTKAGFGGGLLTTRDLNNDGEVDILRAEPDFELMTREGSGISYLWILSWNGKNGRLINDTDSRTHQSVIVSIEEMYDFLDVHKNGVVDIRGQIPEIWREYFPGLRPKTLPAIVYTWNGHKYGYWTNPTKSH